MKIRFSFWPGGAFGTFSGAVCGQTLGADAPAAMRQMACLVLSTEIIIGALSVVIALLAGLLFWNRSLSRRLRRRAAELEREHAAHKADMALLEQSESKLRSLFLAAPVGIGLVKNRVLMDVNEQVCRIAGYRKEELIGKNARLLYPTQEEYEAVGRDKYNQIDQVGVGTVQTRWQRKDGAIRHVLLSSSPLDTADREKGVSFTVMDITDRRDAEEALREQERQLKTLLANLPGMAYRCQNTPDWETEFVSEGCCGLLGCRPEELMGEHATPYSHFIYPGDRQYVWKNIQQAIARREKYALEYRIRAKDGTTKWVWEQGAGVYSEDGQLVALEGLIIDITARKQIKQALQESRNLLQSVLDTIPVRVFWKDLDLNYLGCNEPFAVDAGLDRTEQIVGKNDRDLSWQDQVERYQCDDREVITSGQPKLFFEEPQTTPDGRQRYLLTSKVPLRAADGAIGGVLGTYQDITDRKKAEQALRESENRYRELIDLAVDGILLGSHDGRIVGINSYMSGLVGKPADDIIGQHISTIFEPESLRQTPLRFDLLHQGQTVVNERTIRRPDGAQAVVEMRTKMMPDSTYQSIIRDVTERKKAERIREELLGEVRTKNEELESIVFIASHDLRSPLVNIRGFTGELEKTVEQLKTFLQSEAQSEAICQKIVQILDRDVAESLYFIKNSSRKMDTLLNGLLRLSRISSAKLNPTVIDVGAMVHALLAGLSYTIRRYEIDIAVEDDLPTCRGDEMLISQVFANLVDNAIKYRHPGRPCQIRIRGRSQDRRSIYQVQDNGIGIQPEDRERVFDVFCQLHPGDGNGDGLGLTIVRRVLDRQNGQIHIDSNDGAGTTATVVLPGA